jgi:hypothetical protein
VPNARANRRTAFHPLACALVALAVLGCESRVTQAGGGRSSRARVVIEGDGGRWLDVDGGRLRVERVGAGS